MDNIDGAARADMFQVQVGRENSVSAGLRQHKNTSSRY